MPRLTHTLLRLCLLLALVWPMAGFAQISEFRMLGGKDREAFMERYAQCIGDPARKSNGHYIAPNGYLGWYQISVFDAYKAGLCKAPVTDAPRSPNAWAFCDFQGPLAKRFMLMHEYDLRYTKRGADAQKAVFDHVIDLYEAELRRYKYYPPDTRKRADRNIPAPEIMIGLMHLWGPSAVEHMLSGKQIIDKNNSSAQGVADCLTQCLTNPLIKDLKCSM